MSGTSTREAAPTRATPGSPMAGSYLAAPTRTARAANGVDYAYRDIGAEARRAAGAAPALPREPRQLGSRADRRAGVGPAGRHVRQRRRRRLHRNDAEHRRADGPRRHRVPRRHGARPGRPPRVLHRQLRRAGDRADQAGASCDGWSWRPRRRRAPPACTAGRPRSSAPSARRTRAPRGTSASSSRRPRPAGRRARRPCGACTRGPRTGTRRRPGRRDKRSTTRSARGGSPITRCCSGSAAIDVPVFVANGDSDPMILPHYSYLLAGLIPQARVKIYPDSAHGFLFQHHAEFAADVRSFLTAAQ